MYTYSCLNKDPRLKSRRDTLNLVWRKKALEQKRQAGAARERRLAEEAQERVEKLRWLMTRQRRLKQVETKIEEKRGRVKKLECLYAKSTDKSSAKKIFRDLREERQELYRIAIPYCNIILYKLKKQIRNEAKKIISEYCTFENDEKFWQAVNKNDENYKTYSDFLVNLRGNCQRDRCMIPSAAFDVFRFAKLNHGVATVASISAIAKKHSPQRLM